MQGPIRNALPLRIGVRHRCDATHGGPEFVDSSSAHVDRLKVEEPLDLQTVRCGEQQRCDDLGVEAAASDDASLTDSYLC